MKRTLRMAGPAAIAGLVATLGAAGCGSTVASLARAGPPPPSISPVSERGAVPWVNQPGQFFKPSPLPVHYRPANAPLCTAAQVRVSPDGQNGATGDLLWYFAFRNVSGSTCILRGYPSAGASEPGEPDVTATHFGWFAKDERSGNMRPGGVTGLVLVTSVNCSAGQANSNAAPVYHSVTVTIPGGGQAVINGSFDLVCGLQTSRFAVRQPQQRYTQSPVSGARVSLDLPSMRPVPPPQAAITLTAHTGTARTTLYWYGRWCGPDPNPVTVAITFPANGAKITVIPTGGWVPALCRGVSAGPHVNPRKSNPDWVSADAFQAGQSLP